MIAQGHGACEWWGGSGTQGWLNPRSETHAPSILTPMTGSWGSECGWEREGSPYTLSVYRKEVFRVLATLGLPWGCPGAALAVGHPPNLLSPSP